MADNIDVTAGAGVTISADDIGAGVLAQNVKLLVSTGGSSTPTGVAASPLEVSLANTAANATAVKVDGSAVTQPVSAAALPLPSGASTAAKQPALGTAGTASADVISVQGIASMTKLLVTPDANSAVNVAQINGVTVLMGNGASGTGAQRVTIANDSTGILAGITTVTTVSTVSAVTAVGTITPGTAASSLGKAEDAAHASGDVGVFALTVRDDATSGQPTTTFGANGDYAPIVVDANYRQYVNSVGNIAHDAVDAGSPLKVGARAVAVLNTATLVAAADRTDVVADLDGAVVTRTGVPLGDLISERAANTDGASTVLTTFGATAGKRNHVTAITVHNAHATTNGYVDIRDGAAGAILWTLPLPATGGTTHNFNPPLRQPTANTALAFDVSAAITTIYLSFNGFQSKT